MERRLLVGGAVSPSSPAGCTRTGLRRAERIVERSGGSGDDRQATSDPSGSEGDGDTHHSGDGSSSSDSGGDGVNTSLAVAEFDADRNSRSTPDGPRLDPGARVTVRPRHGTNTRSPIDWSQRTEVRNDGTDAVTVGNAADEAVLERTYP